MNGSLNSMTCLGAKVVVTHLQAGICMVELYGELDNLSYKEISSFIEEELTREDRSVILELSNLTFMDSSGLKLLSGMALRFGLDNCAIHGVNDNIRRILRLGPLAKRVIEQSEHRDVLSWRGIA